MTAPGFPAPLVTAARPTTLHAPPPSRGGLQALTTVMLLLTAGSSWVGQQQLDRLFYRLDADRLRRAEDALTTMIDQQRARLLASVRILSEDTRIRSTATTTGFDEGTIRDVLEDLKTASDVNVLAVLDERGKVRAITGAEGLRQMDLSSSPVIRAAQEHPASYTWTLPGQVVIIGVAPIRVGPRVSALLLMGLTLGAQQLAAVERTMGVNTAMFTGDRLVAASGSLDENMTEILRISMAEGDGESRAVQGHPNFLARVTRTSESANAAKLIWVVASQQQSPQARVLRAVVWLPVVFAALTFGFVLWMIRKRKGGA